jgi:hypothetical protein
MSRLSLAPIVLAGAATIVLLAGCGGGSSSNNASPAVTQKVTGFVTDADTAAPITGAIVKVQGTNITSTTAADGSYIVGPLNPTRSYTLTITNTGYVTSSVKMLSKNATLQGPGVILTRGNPADQITNATGGTSTSNATLEGNVATVAIPANAMPGGTDGGNSTTLLVGTAVPGASPDTSKIVYPVINFGVTGSTANFTQPVTVTIPVGFAMTAGASVPVMTLGATGIWAPVTPALNATVSADGKSASFNTTVPGTYGLSLSVQAAVAGTVTATRTPVAGPYTDPVVVPLTGATVNWSATGADGRDFLDATFTESQRELNINVPGDLDATQLVIHPRGTSLINVVKNAFTVNFTATGLTIQQAGSTVTGTVDGLAYYEIVPHQQGSGTGG